MKTSCFQFAHKKIHCDQPSNMSSVITDNFARAKEDIMKALAEDESGSGSDQDSSSSSSSSSSSFAKAGEKRPKCKAKPHAKKKAKVAPDADTGSAATSVKPDKNAKPKKKEKENVKEKEEMRIAGMITTHGTSRSLAQHCSHCRIGTSAEQGICCR